MLDNFVVARNSNRIVRYATRNGRFSTGQLSIYIAAFHLHFAKGPSSN